MALLSPGVEVSVIDESQFIPAATNSVPYILLATAQNKVSGTGVGVAAGTLKANANRVYLITSQRDLSATYGVPFFYKTTAGTPINGYELNEYGLLAAYSALGITNRAFIQRVDIDLSELTASLVRPTGNPANGNYWLDTANTAWGIFQWNITTGAFSNQVPSVITDTAYLENSSTVPLQSYGSIGDYAVTATNINNPGYYKRGGPVFPDQTSSEELGDMYNTWVLVGSDEWKTAWPTVQGTAAPTSLTGGQTIVINDTTVTVGSGSTANTVLGLQEAINNAGITGIYASAIDGKLNLYADSTTTIGDSTDIQGAVKIGGTSTAGLLTALGLTVGEYLTPEFFHGPNYSQPRWKSTDTQPAPTGSIWVKTNNVNLGTNIVIKKFSTGLGVFVQQACPVYSSNNYAIYGIDPSGGGKNIPAGTTYAHVDPTRKLIEPGEFGFLINERYASGATIITGDTDNPGPFTPGDSFTITGTQPGTTTVISSLATIGGAGTVADFIAAVSAAAVPYVSAAVNSSGAIVWTHSQGGDIVLVPASANTALIDAGLNANVRGVTTYTSTYGTAYELSNWVIAPTFTYTASGDAPDQDPDSGRLWYYSATTQADIMIQNNGAWYGYQNVTNDVRGDNLTLTNAAGPIFATTAPATQTDASQSPLQYGDLWIDTSDLENYPLINRWSVIEGVDQWVPLDNSDQTTENGVLFADARWAPNGTTNPITDPVPSISSLLTSDYLDLDAPTATLYPQGMLLFNTRRSGFNVKKFEADYFNSQSFPSESLPEQTSAWVTASGNKNNGSPYMGRQAQRALIVAALKSGIDTSVEAREEQRQYNLIATPSYPELIPNMILLNNDRKETGFVIGDTPMRLDATADSITTWVTNNSGAGVTTSDGLSTSSVYAGVFYPSCQTTDLGGSPVVQPPSHMMIRTIIRNDEVAFPWLAPAGTRRGVIDNAARIGYINGLTGEFITIGVQQSLRDVLYENDINPITFVPGIGITNFGNKTITSDTTALDRINVARLVAFIRSRLMEIGNNFLFQPNDQITRNELTNSVNSLMIDLVNKRGIYDYLVVCDLSNNTPARIDRNELYVDIAIEPVKAVEFIYIPLRIKNTGEIGASISTVATAA